MNKNKKPLRWKFNFSRFNTLTIVKKEVKSWIKYTLDFLRIIPGKYICTLRDGTKVILRGKTMDGEIFKEIFLWKIYSPKGFETKEGDIVVDIGAHIGAYSLQAASKAKLVLAYEPSPENFLILVENRELNKFRNLIPYPIAISGQRRHLKFFRKDDGGRDSIYKEKHVNTEIFNAISIKLEDILIK